MLEVWKKKFYRLNISQRKLKWRNVVLFIEHFRKANATSNDTPYWSLHASNYTLFEEWNKVLKCLIIKYAPKEHTIIIVDIWRLTGLTQ